MIRILDTQDLTVSTVDDVYAYHIVKVQDDSWELQVIMKRNKRKAHIFGPFSSLHNAAELLLLMNVPGHGLSRR